jgi:2-dehydro-3-deoxyphosphooctonate aldolase (KDO 8-P synthase)
MTNSKLYDKICHPDRLTVIAGPCQIESLRHCLKIANYLKDKTSGIRNLNLIFKASFDKANRTKITSSRGVGLETGLEILNKVKSETGLPVLTDVHESYQVRFVAEVADVIQIPAFLCRQTDLVVEAANTQKILNLKKGQFLSPQKMRYVVEKAEATGNNKILICERGSCFGHNDLVVDFRGLIQLQEPGYPVIFDATHSSQSGGNGITGGDRRYALPLAKAAISVGASGVFMECHDNPKNAPSDAESMVYLKSMPSYIKQLLRLKKVVKNE